MLVFIIPIVVIYQFTKKDEVIVPAMKALSADSEYLMYPRMDNENVVGEGKLGLLYKCLTGYRGLNGRRANGEGGKAFVLVFSNGISLNVSSTDTETFQFSASVILDDDTVSSKFYAVNCQLSLLEQYW
ncbi:hypothetical protein [Shewanella woodyi]|uniref:hypothetical protein n=1 Tax=Shewanella woodyi TaxID=60961 RepID=UPI0037488661